MDYVPDYPQIEIIKGRIVFLRFYDSYIQNIESVAKIKNLKKLIFNECNISTNALDSLGKSKALSVLEITDVPFSNITNFKFISECKQLTHLDVENTDFDDEDLIQLINLPNLKTLVIDGCHNLTDLSPLIEIKSLRRLSADKLSRSINNIKIVEELRLRGVEVSGYPE